MVETVAPTVRRRDEHGTGPAVAAARRPSKRTRRGRVALLVALFLVLAAAAGGWAWWRQVGGAPDVYVTASVERTDIEDSVTALGSLQPRDFVDVGTQVSGQLKKVHVEIGATVKAGDLLAEIDPTVYLARVEAARAQLLNLKAQLAEKQAQLQLAERQFQRQSNLMKANATSEDAYQSSEAAMRSATAQVEALKAQIQQTESTLKGDEANLGYTRIYAPIAGTVVSQTAKQGQTLNANQQAPIIVRVADLSTMTVWAQVSEADVPKLRIGMEAYFTILGNPDRRWYGMLRQILPTPEVINNVVLYDALFDVPNPDQDLMTQMSAQVFFVVAGAKDVLTVPIAALHPAGGLARGRDASTGGGARREAGARPGGAQEPGDARRPRRYAVTVLMPDGTTVEREVRVGIMNRVAAEVLSGLEPGERVVVGSGRAGGPSQPGSSGRPGVRTPRLS
ncbi:MAG: efflux RND transporter periplasmic adaptor subunit [Proteobacteria bacterium]|nr:efflux RND transporter periplasmic adaptor subunit [Pseudomonadota bacterium]